MTPQNRTPSILVVPLVLSAMGTISIVLAFPNMLFQSSDKPFLCFYSETASVSSTVQCSPLKLSYFHPSTADVNSVYDGDGMTFFRVAAACGVVAAGMGLMVTCLLLFRSATVHKNACYLDLVVVLQTVAALLAISTTVVAPIKNKYVNTEWYDLSWMIRNDVDDEPGPLLASGANSILVGGILLALAALCTIIGSFLGNKGTTQSDEEEQPRTSRKTTAKAAKKSSSRSISPSPYLEDDDDDEEDALTKKTTTKESINV